MKVVHISWSDRLESASRGAAELHRALLKEGVESRLLIKQNGDPLPEGVERLACREDEAAAILQSFCFDQNEADPIASAFHIGYPGASVCSHPAVANCDLIHLHQAAGAVSPAEIRALAALGKPMVWSLPDAWAFTGGCFQTGSCARFAEGCSQCPQVRDDSFHLPSRLLADKVAQLAGIENLTLLIADHSLATQARASKIFPSIRIEPIPPMVADGAPNGKAADTALGQAADTAASTSPVRVVFVFDSPGCQERNLKLLNDLLEATQTFGAFRKLVLSEQVRLIATGSSQESKVADLPVHFIKGSPAREADLLVLARPEENRQGLLLEARTLGVPVLAFDQGGIGQVIEHRRNGWLVEKPEVLSMAEALCYLAANPEMVRQMAESAPAQNEALTKTLALYRELLSTPAVPAALPVENGENLAGQFQKLVGSIARLALSQRVMNERLAGFEAAQKRLRGTEELLVQAQGSLAKLEQRQERLAQSGKLSKPEAQELTKIRKSTASLRNKLKWRARRLKIYNSLDHILSHSGEASGQLVEPPAIPAWIRLAHRLFLKNHWMKHGKKEQYRPRPVRPEQLPKPRLAESALPRIAVVTPSFQQGDYLEATIKSVLDQNYPNLAYAIQDGGSTDSTFEVIQRYADRVTLWASQPDSGQTRAIVSGFEKISGDIMAWLNSDDLLVPGALRFAGEYFAAHPEVDVIYGHRIIINEHGEEVARWVVPPHNPAITPYVDPVPQETMFWRSSLWKKVGGLDSSFRFAMDWDLVLRFQKAGANIVRVPYFLGIFRTHSQQKTSARAESLGIEEIGYLRKREIGHPVTEKQLAPYRQWMETCGAVYSRLLELGIRV